MVGRDARGAIPLESRDFAVAGSVLGRAFRDDPLWSVILSDPDTRQSQLARMFTGLAKMTATANGLAETTPALEAVARWLGPGEDYRFWTMVRSGMAMPRFAMKLPAADRRRMLSVLRQTDERRRKLMPRPHWYLEAIGVDPQCQGAGLGSGLVRSGIRRADPDHTPIYLETETETNVGFYKHLGFEVVEQTVATALDVPL